MDSKDSAAPSGRKRRSRKGKGGNGINLRPEAGAGEKTAAEHLMTETAGACVAAVRIGGGGPEASLEDTGSAAHRQSRGEMVAGIVFTLLVIGALVAAGMVIKQRFYDGNFLPVDTITIRGTLDQNSVEEISSLLSNSGLMGNFIRLNVDDVRQLVEELPWVQSAAVRKQWPSLLQLHITEKIPQVRWGADRLYSQSVGIFTPPEDRTYPDLVRIDAPDELASAVFPVFIRCQILLARHGFAVDAVRVSDRRSWEFVLKNGPLLILGREQEEFEDRIERFARIYRMMRDQERQLTAYADLRYENGIALGWKSDDATPQEGGTAVRR